MGSALEVKETAYNELKASAEKKIAKLTSQFEEKLKKAQNSQDEASESRFKTLEASAEQAKLESEQKLRALEELLKSSESEIEELKIKEISAEKDRSHWEVEKEMLEGEAKELTDRIEGLEAEVKKLTAANETKAVKADTDARKVVRELQKEVKQLYNELNDKNQQFDMVQEELTRLKTSKETAENGQLQVQKQMDEEDRRSEFSVINWEKMEEIWMKIVKNELKTARNSNFWLKKLEKNG